MNSAYRGTSFFFASHGTIFRHFFFSTAKAIEEFWRMTMISAYRITYENETETLLTLSLDSFNQAVGKLKSSAKVKNPIAYYTCIMNKKFQEIYFWEAV